MKVKDLIRILEDMPESFKNLPIRVSCADNEGSTYKPNKAFITFDECNRKCILIK